ncbi:GIY-YIG nuclease family protein [Candidatus Roizmanbacteria bacterium]|nr:MAG: GIY-YIG nuclease family protein [Candidatus Roizmanbacteria bacterium]
MKNYYVYIMASGSGTLYIGMTNDLERRVYEHKHNIIEGFSQKYSCHKLVYYEQYQEVTDAIEREKQLKKWRRSKKEFLISKQNPAWVDLGQEWK